MSNLRGKWSFSDFQSAFRSYKKSTEKCPLNEHDLFLRSTLFRTHYERLHELLSMVFHLDRIEQLTLRCFNRDESRVVALKKNIKILSDAWKRSMVSATLVDCGFPNLALSLKLEKEKNLTEEFLGQEAQEMFNHKAAQYTDIQTNVSEDPCDFSRHHLVAADLKFSSREVKKIQFYSAVVCSKVLNRYTSQAFPITIPEKMKIDHDLQFPVRKGVNCFSFATGYETENNESLIPGALPKEAITHPIAWVSDKVLQDQGLIRIDSMLCKDFNNDFLNFENPVYLIAVIHSGKHTGRPDAHVIRCFYNAFEKQLVWLQSGGTKQVTFVKRQNKELVTGIPDNPEETFCDQSAYPCFLGYYLVMDTVK